MSEGHVKRRGSAAFTLVELMIVLFIGTILGTIAWGGFSIIAPMSFDSSTSTVSELLEQCRTYAVAHDTYVYVGSYSENTAMPPQLWLTAVASPTGVDISQNGNVDIDGQNGAILVSKIIKLPNVIFSSNIPSGSQSSGSIDIQPGAPSIGLQQRTFSTLFWFEPNGTIANAGNNAKNLEFGISSANPSSFSGVFQVSGLTGINALVRQ